MIRIKLLPGEVVAVFDDGDEETFHSHEAFNDEAERKEQRRHPGLWAAIGIVIDESRAALN